MLYVRQAAEGFQNGGAGEWSELKMHVPIPWFFQIYFIGPKNLGDSLSYICDVS